MNADRFVELSERAKLVICQSPIVNNIRDAMDRRLPDSEDDARRFFSHLETAGLRAAVTHGRRYLLTGDALAMWSAASDALLVDPELPTLGADDLPAGGGVVWFDRPQPLPVKFPMSDDPEDITPVDFDALAWSTVPRPDNFLTDYQDQFDTWPVDDGMRFKPADPPDSDMVVIAGLIDLARVAPNDVYSVGPMPVPTAICLWRLYGHEPPNEQTDWDNGGTMALLAYTFWRLLADRIIVDDDTATVSRPLRRQIARATGTEPAPIKVVDLPLIQRRTTGQGDGTGRRQLVRSPVHGFWRNQPWGPGNTLRRKKYVRAHWRGPVDGPVVIRDDIIRPRP